MKSGYCIIIWNIKDHGTSEMTPTTPKAGLHPKKVM